MSIAATAPDPSSSSVGAACLFDGAWKGSGDSDQPLPQLRSDTRFHLTYVSCRANSSETRLMIHMKTTKILYLLGLATLFVSTCLIAADQPVTNLKSFDWANRPELTRDQQKLLYLYKKYDWATPPTRDEVKAEIQKLAAKLGPLAVRPAQPFELILSRVGETNLAAVQNLTDTNLAFTVSIKGDEEWLGSRKASLGRNTFLPPKSALYVTNLYWTTPGMTKPGDR